MALEDRSPEVRAAAVRALAEAKGAGAEAVVLRGLLDADAVVRAEAGQAAARLAFAPGPAHARARAAAARPRPARKALSCAPSIGSGTGSA
jgi:HEAT repeat protein